ncbi:MAG: hypothetical protein U0487_02090 [Patescibacteria group bacterium]
MQNPFLRPSQREAARYSDPKLKKLASKLVFETTDLTADHVNLAFEQVRRLPGTEPTKELNNTQEAFLGIAAHEAAEQAFEAFTAELTKYKQPENLTRAEIRTLFERSRYAKTLQKHEQAAISHFSNVLKDDEGFIASTSDNTRFDAIDIKTYLIDLQNRIAERLEDPEERKAKLEKLDTELATLIKSVPEQEWGKKLELQEIYLLRRMIHRADTGHLAHVAHGTLRQDLRADMGSVDMRLTAAGDIYDFQVKTFKANAGREAKAAQYHSVAKHKQHVESMGTHFVILQTDSVQVAYERSQRQKTSDNQTVGDKFAALQPLTNNLNARERSRLLKLVGLTEETLAKEQAAFDEQQQRMDEHLKEVRTLAAAERIKQEEIDQRYAEEQAAAIAAEIAKEKAIRDHQEAQRLASATDREVAAQTKAKNLEAKRLNQAREKAMLAEAEKQREALAQAEKLKAAKKLETKESREQSKAVAEWVKTQLAKLLTPNALIEAGFLAPEDRNAIPKILAAKKEAEQLYTKKYILNRFPYQNENPAAE